MNKRIRRHITQRQQAKSGKLCCSFASGPGQPIIVWSNIGGYTERISQSKRRRIILASFRSADQEARFKIDFQESKASYMRRKEEERETAEAIRQRKEGRVGGFAITSGKNGVFIEDEIGGEMRPISREEAGQRVRDFLNGEK